MTPRPAAGGRQTLLPGYRGPTLEGAREVLAELHDDVVLATRWAARGFEVIDLPGGLDGAAAAGRRVHAYLRERAAGVGLDYPESLGLGAYHRLPGLDDPRHLHIARWGVPFELFGIDRAEITDLVSVRVRHPMRLFFLQSDPSVPEMCGLRVIRPGQGDHNPYHRDGWFEDLRHAVTLWIPLVNCPAGSSLRVFSGSHLWPESEVRRTPEGVRIGKRKYNVPALVELRRSARPTEPLPTIGRGLLFSSYLIHGGGENRQVDKTRVSFELRFVKQTSGVSSSCSRRR